MWSRKLETIGLIAAISLERRALLHYIKERSVISIGKFRGVQFHLKGRRDILITSGMGLENAISATRALCREIHPQLLVSFGIAGAVNNNLEIGDVVIARKTCLYKMGKIDQMELLASLSDRAWKSVERTLTQMGVHLENGIAITRRGNQLIQPENKELIHYILEMETFGIAEVAKELKIPLISIRSISDSPKSPIPLDVVLMINEKYYNRMGKILRVILRRPQIFIQFRQMLQNSKTAANHASLALMSVLNQSSPIIIP
jgi:adenosylhomocysteine nucleosidase